jgi:hypothetical protein
MSLVFYKFRAWQNDPNCYIQDIRDCREQLEPLWHGLLLALGFPEVDWMGAYETYADWINNEI